MAEFPEVFVSGQIVPMTEIDRVRNAVCLLKSSTHRQKWSATGFYLVLRLKKNNKVSSVHCIITNHHVYKEMEKHNDGMVAVFHHHDNAKAHNEVPLVPFKLFAQSKSEELDYALIKLDESLKKNLESIGVTPLEADGDKLPTVSINDYVYIFQHPAGLDQHFSQDSVKRINGPFLEYYADTSVGSSGAPVLVYTPPKLRVVALHSKGVYSYPINHNKGVLLCDILHHLRTGKVRKLFVPTHGIPDQLESGVLAGTKDPLESVKRDDIMNIAKDIVDVWKNLARVLGLSESDITIINADNEKIYEKSFQMLMKWTHIYGSAANFGTLAKGLCHPTVQRPCLVKKFC